MQMNRMAAFVKIVFSVVLLILACATMPIDFLTELESRYNDYKKKYPYVSLSLSLNQPSYIPGDSVFFSANYFYEDKQFVKGVHLIRLDILAPNGSTVQTVRFKSTDGIGYNQLVIRNDIAPGIYKFVAYTDWMRNFGSEAFFQLDVPIVGKQHRVKIKDEKNLVAFYPEGGHLIQGLNGRILAVGPPNQEVVVIDESNTKLNTFQLNSAGVAVFNFRPELNKKYFGFLPQGTLKWNLPEVESDGVAIKLDEESKRLGLSIVAKSKFARQELFALILSNGKIVKSDEVRFDDSGLSTIELPSHLNSEGLHQVFILDANGKEIAQRVFRLASSQDVKIKFRVADKTKQRTRFTFAVGVLDESDRLIESDLSLAIFQDELFNTKTTNKIPVEELPSVQAWASEHAENYLPLLNDYLISKKWNRIDWESVYTNRPPNFQFPFRGQNTISGKVIVKENNKPVPDSTLVIAYLQKNTMGYEAYTKDGRFEIPLIFDFWDEDIVFYTTRSRGKCMDERFSIITIKDSLDLKSTWNSKELPEKNPYAAYALKRSLIDRSYNFFSGGGDANLKSRSPNEIFEEEFQEVDYTVNVADYVVFPTMEEMLREVVTFVQFRKKGTEATVRLYHRYEKTVMFYKNDPVYIIDGVMSTSTSYFLSLKPENLLSIKVINNPNKLAQLGHLGENGFIFVESKKGNLAQTSNNNLFPVTGLSRSVGQRNPVAGNMPDLRSTLYWNPSLKSDLRGYNEITFLTSDDVGSMKIKVNGITRDGRAFSAEQNFVVELNSNRP
jgi:hypothetical protein